MKGVDLGEAFRVEVSSLSWLGLVEDILFSSLYSCLIKKLPDPMVFPQRDFVPSPHFKFNEGKQKGENLRDSHTRTQAGGVCSNLRYWNPNLLLITLCQSKLDSSRNCQSNLPSKEMFLDTIFPNARDGSFSVPRTPTKKKKPSSAFPISQPLP